MAKKIKLLITEKTSDFVKLDKYSFFSTLSINKIEFAKFIAKKFEVKVLKVNKQVVNKKVRKVGNKSIVRRKAGYKFILTLDKWFKINVEDNKIISFV